MSEAQAISRSPKWVILDRTSLGLLLLSQGLNLLVCSIFIICTLKTAGNCISALIHDCLVLIVVHRNFEMSPALRPNKLKSLVRSRQEGFFWIGTESRQDVTAQLGTSTNESLMAYRYWSQTTIYNTYSTIHVTSTSASIRICIQQLPDLFSSRKSRLKDDLERQRMRIHCQRECQGVDRAWRIR